MHSRYFLMSHKLLQEGAIAHLDNLTTDGFSHFAGQVQASICLIHRVALRARKVDEMAAMFQHLRTARLLSGLIGQMGRGNGGAGCYGIATNIGVNEPHGHILGERVQRPLRGGVGSTAKGTCTIEEILMMTPSFLGRKIFSASRIYRMGPPKLVFITYIIHSSSVSSIIFCSPIPALLIRISTSPNSCNAV